MVDVGSQGGGLVDLLPKVDVGIGAGWGTVENTEGELGTCNNFGFLVRSEVNIFGTGLKIGRFSSNASLGFQVKYQDVDCEYGLLGDNLSRHHSIDIGIWGFAVRAGIAVAYDEFGLESGFLIGAVNGVDAKNVLSLERLPLGSSIAVTYRGLGIGYEFQVDIYRIANGEIWDHSVVTPINFLFFSLEIYGAEGSFWERW